MNKTNNFLTSFLTIGTGTFVNLLLGLLTTPIITRIVDPIEYGQLSIFTMYSNIAVMVLCLGLDQAFVRYYYESEEKEYKMLLLSKCICLPVIVSITCSIFMIINSIYKWFNFEFNTLITILLCTYTIIQIIYRFSIAVIRLNYNSKLYSKLQVLLKFIYIILALSLIYSIQSNYLLLLCISTVGSAVICLIVSIVAQRDIWSFSKREHSNNIKFKELIRYAYPFIFSMGITTLFQAIDKISLNYYHTYSEVGIYSSAMSIINVFALIQTTFNTLWAPMAVQHYTQNPKDKEFYKKGNSAITIVMFFMGISLILFKDIFVYLLGAKYREATHILPFLIFNPIMYTISETTVNGLIFMKKSKMQVVVAVGACLTNIIGNILLVPKLGCIGAAISTGISYIVFFTLRTILSNKYFYIDFKLNRFYILTFIVSIYAIYNTFVEFNIFSLIGYMICLGALYLLYMKEIKYYLKQGLNQLNSKMRNRSNK